MITPPYSQEAEEAVIGSVLINPTAFYTVRGIIQHSDFYLVKHSYIWQAMSAIVDAGNKIELVALQHRLAAAKQLEAIGGAAYLTTLIANTPTAVYCEVYAQLVKRTAQRRRLMAVSDEIKALALDEQISINDVMSNATSKLFSAVSATDGDEPSFYESVSSYTETMLEVWNNPTKTLGVPTGHQGIDKHTLGMQPHEVIYVIARPGVGKTVVLLQWALAAAKAGHKVGFWSGEMSRHQMIERACASISGIPNSVIRTGNLSPDQRKRMTDATVTLSKLPIVGFWTKAALSPSELKMLIMKTQAAKGLDVMFIDYLGLMRGDDKTQSKYHEVSSISVELKNIANSCNIPVVSGVQLSRGLEQRQDKRPQLYDMRDSGSLEQDADIVYGLYRDEYYNENTETPGMIEINQIKNRHGETRSFYASFDGATSTIKETELRKVKLA